MATLGFLGVAVLTGGAAELRGVGMETRSCPLLPTEGAPTLSDGSSLPMANTLFLLANKALSNQIVFQSVSGQAFVMVCPGAWVSPEAGREGDVAGTPGPTPPEDQLFGEPGLSCRRKASHVGLVRKT